MTADEILSNRVLAILQRWQTRWLGPELVVAVSGGSDSVGLLRLLDELSPTLGLRLSVAHLNHNTRGEASAKDAQFVAELAESLGWPFDCGQWTPTRTSHFEADARKARMAWLLQIARDRKANAVAVGHTSDDQAETILQRILRGTGPRGLTGIPARRRLEEGIALVRPLLKVSRAEVRSYLLQKGQPWREDSTNFDLSRTRSRIRHDLLPKLIQEYNPQVADALIQLGQLTKGWEKALRPRVARIERAATLYRDPETIQLDRSVIVACPLPLRSEVLRRAWRLAGWPERAMNADRWHRLSKLVKQDRGLESFGQGVVAEVTTNQLILRRTLKISPVRSPDSTFLPIPGEIHWGNARIRATLDTLESSQERVDFDQIVPPLKVRAPVPGDRFEPLGMGGRSTPLNDFFRGRGISKADRAKVPIVEDQQGLIWVVGQRISDRVRLTPATKTILGLSWEPCDRTY